MTEPGIITFALAQINPTVGDIAGNAVKIFASFEQARDAGADMVVFPELALVGYPPEDLILMPAFCTQAMQALADLAAQTADGPALVVGSVWMQDDGMCFNAAILLDGGKIVHVQPKTLLPNYGVFDEKRLFFAGPGPVAVQWRGVTIGLLVCEDIWRGELAEELAGQGAEVLIVINASPFETGKRMQRIEIAAEAAYQARLPLVYVNMVGGQDDIVFDGGSFVLAPSASSEIDVGMVAQLAEFEETIAVVTVNLRGPQQALEQARGLGYEESLWRAMMLGLADYVGKNGFSGVMLGLSGGIDSALSAALAVDALGAERVKGVLLPSPYTSAESVEDALHSARLLGIETMNVPITQGMELFESLLSPAFNEANWMENVSIGGNVQARLRGMTLMSISNRFGWMLLSTGNKSELAVGYSTLYGDSCGGYNVLKDLYKLQVYELANWRNEAGGVIPARSISKAPSAELAPGQKDADQLPPYDILDNILARHIEGRLSADEIVAQGYERAVVEKVVRMVRLSEYKRRQSCPGVKLSPMLFGKDRRYPMTNRF